MPELPEVETIVRQLKDRFTGDTIKHIEILDEKLLRGHNWQSLTGRRVYDVSRRGKYIIFELSGNWRLIVHLRMTGKLLWQRKDQELTQHTRAVVHSKGGNLLLDDVRRLAVMFPSRSGCELNGLGVEPLSADFNVGYLQSRLVKSKLIIKDFLLSQSKIAGIGNIYASEILFASGVHPQRRAFSLNQAETEKLVSKTREILELAIKHSGTTISNYRDMRSQQGEFQTRLKVYGREGKPCSACQSPIKRIKQKGRSTYLCEKCQE